MDALGLIGAERHAILHARGGGALANELEDGIYNVFAIEDGRIARIDDFADRAGPRHSSERPGATERERPERPARLRRDAQRATSPGCRRADVSNPTRTEP